MLNETMSIGGVPVVDRQAGIRPPPAGIEESQKKSTKPPADCACLRSLVFLDPRSSKLR
jgi:hypothetical protein